MDLFEILWAHIDSSPQAKLALDELEALVDDLLASVGGQDAVFVFLPLEVQEVVAA